MDINNKFLSENCGLNIVSEFSQFLGHGNNGIKEILQHLNRVSFVQFGCQSVHITRLNSKNELLLESISGVEISKEFADTQQLSLDSKLPIVDVIRSGKILWINTLPDWGVDYPLLKDFPIDFHGKTFIAVPVFDEDIAIGGLSLVCKPKLFEDDCFNDFFAAMAGLLSIALSKL